MKIMNNPEITFISSNNHKFQEIRRIFAQYSKIEVKHIPTELRELQADNLEEIASFSLKDATKVSNDVYSFVEDSGIFIESLNGFPGPYSSYIFKTIGNEGIIKLMHNVTHRKAFFKSVIALKTTNEILIFTGVVDGFISETISDSGWGYDPIFCINADLQTTLGDLGRRKDEISHRYHASRKLIDYLENDPNFYKF